MLLSLLKYTSAVSNRDDVTKCEPIWHQEGFPAEYTATDCSSPYSVEDRVMEEWREVVTMGWGEWGYDDVIKWNHRPRYWPFVRGIHRSPVNSPHKGQWRGALMFSLIYAWINVWVNNDQACDLRRHRAHYDVIVMEMNAAEWLRLRGCVVIGRREQWQSSWNRLIG